MAKAWVGAALIAAVSACASYSGRNLVPGKSTAAEVEATMGKPAELVSLVGGDVLWQYPRGPAGRQTYAVRLGPDNVVREVSQVLTMQNLAQLVPGESTPEDAKRVLGPPFRIVPMTRLRRDVWEYYMYDDTRPIIVYLQFDPDRRLREVLRVDATAFRSRGR
jgi:hypothetical protein